MKRRSNKSTRGVTLVETMIALIVLATGIAALFGMATHVQTANRSLSFQTQSVDIFSRLTAQFRDARCDFDPVNPAVLILDPALNQATGAWINTPSGSISYVGDTGGPTQTLPQTVPAMRIDYRLTRDLSAPNVPAFIVDIRVRELMIDPAMNDPNMESGYWIRTYPMVKTCNARLEGTARGEFL